MDATALILLILFMIGVGLALYYAVICFQVHPLREKLPPHSDMGPLLEQDMNGNNEGSPFTPSALLQPSLDSPDSVATPKRKANPVSPVPDQEDNLELPPRPIDLKITPGCASKDHPKEGCVVLPIDEEPSLLDGSKPLRHSKEPSTLTPAPPMPLPQRFPPISPMHLLAGPDCFEEDGLRVPNPLPAQRTPQPEKERPIGFVCPTDAAPQQCGPPRKNTTKQVHFITPPVFVPCFVNDTNNPPQFGQPPLIKTTPVHSSSKCESAPPSKSLPSPENPIICELKHKSEDDDVTPTPKRVKHNLEEEPILQGVCVDNPEEVANRPKENSEDPSSPSSVTTVPSTQLPKKTSVPSGSSPPADNRDKMSPQDNRGILNHESEEEKDGIQVVPPPSTLHPSRAEPSAILPDASGSPVVPAVPFVVSKPSVASVVPSEPVTPLATSEPSVSLASEPPATTLAASEPSADPVVSLEPSVVPLVASEPSTALLVASEHSTVPLVASEPSTVPPVASEPSTVPPVALEPSTVPLVAPEPSTVPLVASESSTVPLVASEPSIVPLVASEPSTVPLVASEPSTEPSTIPLVASESSTVPLVVSEPPSLHVTSKAIVAAATNLLLSDLPKPVTPPLSNPSQSTPPDSVDCRPQTCSEITEGKLPDSPSPVPENDAKIRSRSSLADTGTESDSDGEISTTTSSDPDVTEYSFHPDGPDVSTVLANEVSSYCHEDSVGLTNYSNLPESPAPPHLKPQPLNSDHPPTPTSDTTKSPSPITCNDLSLDEITPSHSPSNLIGTPPSTPPGDEGPPSYILKPSPTHEESPSDPPAFIMIKAHKTSRKRHESTSSSSSDSSSSTSNGSYKLEGNFKEDRGPGYYAQSFPQRRESPSDIPPRLK